MDSFLIIIFLKNLISSLFKLLISVKHVNTWIMLLINKVALKKKKKNFNI